MFPFSNFVQIVKTKSNEVSIIVQNNITLQVYVNTEYVDGLEPYSPTNTKWNDFVTAFKNALAASLGISASDITIVSITKVVASMLFKTSNTSRYKCKALISNTDVNAFSMQLFASALVRNAPRNSGVVANTSFTPIIESTPVDCSVSNWSSWGDCSVTCGGGSQIQTRSIVTQPVNGGAACPILIQSQSCNTQACPTPDPTPTPVPTPTPHVPVNCVVSDWSDSTTCSVSCGGGTKTQTRLITTPATNGGTACPVLSRDISCNTQACPTTSTVANASITNGYGYPFSVVDTSGAIQAGFESLNNYTRITAITASDNNNTITLTSSQYITYSFARSKFTGTITISDSLSNLTNEKRLALQTNLSMNPIPITITGQSTIDYTPTLVIAGLDASGMYISCNITNTTTTDPSQFIYIWSVTPATASVTFSGNNSYIFIPLPTTIQTVTCRVYYGTSLISVSATITISG